MVRSTWMVVVVGAIIGPASAWADDAYLIKLKGPVRGGTVLTRTRSTIRSQSKGDNLDGKSLVKTTKTEKEAEYRQTVLEIPEGQKNPSRLRRQYDKAESKVGDKKVILPYQNKSVLIEKNKDGPFRFRIEGGPELTGKDADSLDTEFNWTSADPWASTTAFLPKKAVRVGETWKFDPAFFLKSPKPDKTTVFNEAKAEATAKLVRAYRKGGRQFGVVEIWVEAPIKELKVGSEKLTVVDGKLICSVTLDCCIDGGSGNGTSATWTQMDCHAQLDLGVEPKPTMHIKGLVKSHTTWQEMLEK